MAENLRKIKSLEKFSESAQYSVAPTRNIGGKVKWQSLSALPSVVKPLIAGLAIGEVTEPLPIPGGIAIFQLRDLRESRYKENNIKFLEYIEFTFSKNSSTTQSIQRDVIVCDDLYNFNINVQNSTLKRVKAEVATLPKALKKELDSLDQNEFLFNNDKSEITKLFMVCDRSETKKLSNEDIKKVNQSIANKRLYGLSQSYIDNLRQEAIIVHK